VERIALGELIHQHVRLAIETAVHEELRAALGTSPYERSDVRRGYRNGTKARKLTGPTGPVLLTLPRATLFRGTGAKEWTSMIVPRYQRRMPEVNEAIIATYLAGGNTRRIRGALQPLLKAAPLSKSAVSRVVGTLKDGLEAWRARSLADLDVIYVYLDGFALRVRSAGKVVSVPVLGVVGVLSDGHKQLLALEICGGESFAAWNGCLDDLVVRGLRAPVLAIIDGHAGRCDAPSGWCGRGPRCNAVASINCATWSGKRRSTRSPRSATTSTASSTRPMLMRPVLLTRPSSARGPSGARAC
jgi:transposase-like protein